MQITVQEVPAVMRDTLVDKLKAAVLLVVQVYLDLGATHQDVNVFSENSSSFTLLEDELFVTIKLLI
ncbi:hypothetical protein P872_08130 [Rhodonellum psychrophilum GCM71 = DSM 17998]|uniref:Uncharacterized protein n=2 Tax=Rhodonellum TaxID=336827 RepID=U5BW68_9BACT|nr:hypothetical protein P872_08130 [Rhodonellum psychrophilum GCM71 = DSM 17998]SDY63912.1 hypothetical protein SAMN05444412_10268 [Rhodonellum ikkaensis]